MSTEMRTKSLADRLAPILYILAVFATCTWVFSLPVFPSRDSPLHLYYISVFRQLLTQKAGVYSDTYRIGSYLPPYAAYYYSLAALNTFVSLETADKIFVCAAIVLFAVSVWTLLKAVNPNASRWTPLLILPVLLNWPLMMGFVNFFFALGLALCALTLWNKGVQRPSLRLRVGYLLFLAAIVVTHPVPWVVVVSFTGLELLLRFCYVQRKSGQPLQERLAAARADLLTFAASLLPYLYLHHFQSTVTQDPYSFAIDPVTGRKFILPPATLAQRLQGQFLTLVRTHGLDVYGLHGLPLIYRFGIDLLAIGALALGTWSLWQRRRSGKWLLVDTWTLYALLLLPAMVIVPDAFGGGYYFVTRLQIMLYVACVVSGSAAVLGSARRTLTVMAVFAFTLCAYTLALGQKYIRPVAKVIASLRQAPVVPAGAQPGLAMQPINAQVPPGLNYDPYFWAAVNYVRRNTLLLYNTAWLGDPIIPIRLRAGQDEHVDGTFFNLNPQFRQRLLIDDATAKALFAHVAFVVMMSEEIPTDQDPFAEAPGATTGGSFANGWHCDLGPDRQWFLCTPPANRASQ